MSEASDVREGTPETLARLFEQNRVSLLAMARRMLSSEAAADDAIQDAFVHVLVSHGQFRGEAKASTWVHRIAVNAALMQLRRGRRRQTESLDALDDDIAERVSAERQPLYDNEGPDRAAALAAALAQLGSVDRTIVVLRLRDEWTTKEVGAHLGLSVAAVKARLHRVRKQLSQVEALAASSTTASTASTALTASTASSATTPACATVDAPRERRVRSAAP